MTNVCVVGMIYKSLAYLDFMVGQMKKYCDCDCGIVANDATPEILEALKSFEDWGWVLEYNDPNPEEYYLNRVYRAWNAGGFYCASKYDVVIFVNSDMGFSPGWHDNLVATLTEDTIPCSRLVESGKMLSGKHAISKNFGRHPSEYQEDAFLAFAEKEKLQLIVAEGLYMPCAFRTEDFLASGGYPEGNVNGMPGDVYFFNWNPVMKEKQHITVFNSIVYHIIEGEMDET